MSFLSALENRFGRWQGKRWSKNALESLGDSIANVNCSIETSDSAKRTCARQHADSADRDYHAAIRDFKANHLVRCNQFIDRAKLHLDIARVQIIHAGEADLELHFEEKSAEWIVTHLAQSLTAAKLAIEYRNCVVRGPVKTSLVTVAKFFHQSIEYLLNNDPLRARRTAYSGLLYLYCISLQLEVDNQCAIFAVSVPHRTRVENSVLEVAEQLANCQRRLISAGLDIPPAAKAHFAEAESTICEVIYLLGEGKLKEVDSAIAAASMQITLAERLFQSTSAGNSSDTNAAQSFVGSVEFQTIVKELCSTLHRTVVRQPEVVEKHLRDSLAYYQSACAEFTKSNMSEADRLAALAYMELDSAKRTAWFLNI